MEICTFHSLVKNTYNINNNIFVLIINNHFLSLRASIVIKNDLNNSGFANDIEYLDSDSMDFEELQSNISSQNLFTNKKKLFYLYVHSTSTRKTFINEVRKFIQNLTKFGHKIIISIESKSFLKTLSLNEYPKLLYLNLPEVNNIDNFNQWRELFAREIGIKEIKILKDFDDLSCIENEYWRLKLNISDRTQTKKYIYTGDIINKLIIWLKMIEVGSIQKAIDSISELASSEEFNFSLLGTLIINHITWGKIKIKDKTKIINLLYDIEKETKLSSKTSYQCKIMYLINIVLLLC